MVLDRIGFCVAETVAVMANEFKSTACESPLLNPPGEYNGCVRLAGFKISRYTTVSLIDQIKSRIAAKVSTAVFFANSNFAVTCQGLREDLKGDRSYIVVNDGIGVDIGVMLLGQARFKENLNGTDFVPALLSETKGLRIFLYGGRPAAVSGAARFIADLGHTVVGEFDGYGSVSDSVVEAIQSTSPDLVLVALGNPRQEAWIVEQRSKLPAAVFIGVGALFDFMSGAMPRAPLIMRQMRMEWLYRLYREPKRLVKRYTIDFLRFLVLCVKT